MLLSFAEMPQGTLRAFAPAVAAAVAAAVIAAGGARYLIRAGSERAIASRLDYLTVVNNHELETVAHFHRERLKDIRIYAENLPAFTEYREALGGDPGGLRRLSRVFGPLMKDDYYAGIALYDRRGRVMLSVPEGASPPSSGGAPKTLVRFLGLRPGPGGQFFFDYEAALKGGGRLLFRVRGDAALSPLLNVWPGAEKTARTTVYQREGDSLLVLNELDNGRFSQSPRSIPVMAGSLVGRAARGEVGPLRGTGESGKPILAVAGELPAYSWLIVSKMDEEEILAGLREKTRLMMLAAAGLVALIFAISLLAARAHRDRVRAEANEERRLLSTAIEQAGESIVITDKDARIIYMNPAFCRATGYAREEALGKTPSLLKSGRHDAAFYRDLWAKLGRGETWEGRFVNRRKDGRLFEEDATITPVRDQDGSVTHFIAVNRDISAVKSLEDQLFHSQKMEAIGRLAGGIAHDFNNILTTINGYAEMLADAASPETQAAGDLAEILGAGRRAALLTRQLLTFSRRAPADPVVLDLHGSVRGMEKILRRTLGEDVRLSLDLSGEPLWVRSDPGQLDQVLMNLAVNARDAMPRGGTLAVRTHAALLESDEVRSLEVIPAGRYAVLVVADGGEGMDPAIVSRIFEPFFTTKEKGKGTGLGLATVFGIVKQNKGHISVESAPGRGATFTIHLPLVAAPADLPAPESSAGSPSLRGDETVLVVEDQSEVLRLVSRALTPQGYRVLSCGSAYEALELARAVEGPIHLLLTDVVMPGMGGAELAAKLRRARPGTRVLYMSGYTDGRLDGLGAAGQKADLLLKPFTADQVCRRVRSAIDGAPPRMA